MAANNDFWVLWNKAETGDVGAEQQVNKLVAKRAGYKVTFSEIPVIDMEKEEIVERRLHWRMYKPNGDRASEHSYKQEDYAWRDAPDYMSDLDAAASLPLPASKYGNPVHVQTTEWEDQVQVEFYEEFDQNILPDDVAECVGTHRAAVRVGAWWAAMTGEKQPDPNSSDVTNLS